MAISRQELLRLARAGAVTRVQELRNELEGIYKAFPDLRSGSRTRSAAGATTRRARRDPGQRTWSAADRKAVSDRMKKYWAARRNPKAAK